MLALFATVAFCAAVAVGGFYAMLRLAPGLSHESNNELVRIASTVTSGLYGLLIAFMVVSAWEGYNNAATRAEDEISALSNVMRDTGGLPDRLRTPVRQDVLEYVQLVVAREWDTLARQQPDLVSRARYERIWDRLYRFRPTTETQRTFFGSVVDRMNDVGRARRLRVYSSRSQVPALLWAVMIAGGVLTVFLLFLSSAGERRTQAAVIGIVAGFVGFVVFLIYALDKPFDGAMRLSTQPYTYFVDQWEGKRL
jgi:Protein of unknown function (DUF4239)